MRITRLQLHDFRRYLDLDIDLAPGLTVVRGPNEAGKTTIQRAIELVLTRKATSASADLDGFRRWDGPADARPVIRIEFEQDVGDGTTAGVLEKAFRGAKGTVTLDWDGQHVSDPTLADQVLAELTGLPTEAFFRSTASIRHHEVADLARDESALRDRLQASISGADRGTSRAKKLLDKALYELNTKGEKNPGRLKVADAAVASETVSVERGEAALVQLERDRDSLSAARERRAGADAILAERRALLEKARQAERLIAERNVAQERFERYRTAVGVLTEIASLAASHPSGAPLPALRQIVERLRALDARIRELTAMLAGEVAVDFQVKRPEPRSWQPTGVASIIAILLGLAIAAGTALRIVVVDSGLLVGLALVVVGAGLAVVGRRQRQGAQDFRRQKELRDDEVDRRLRGRSQLEQELREAEAEIGEQLERLELPDSAAAEDLLRREEEHVATIDRLEAQLDGLVGKAPPETLPALRDAAALEIEQKTGALDQLGPIAKEPRARERLEVEVRDAESAVDRARDDEAGAKARVETNVVDAEEVAGHAERLAAWQEQLAALQRRARIYEATLRAIIAAEQATMRAATRYLEKHMVGDVARVTDGRYRRVRVDDATLDIDIFAPERGDWVDVESLSQGTLDLVYLAARLGLVRLVTGDRRPPLIFDDPFVTLDDARAARALELLREIARDFQVIYLTTSDRYDGAADAVRLLDGPITSDDWTAAEPAGVGD